MHMSITNDLDLYIAYLLGKLHAVSRPRTGFNLRSDASRHGRQVAGVSPVNTLTARLSSVGRNEGWTVRTVGGAISI
jgi:hypothetical protein